MPPLLIARTGELCAIRTPGYAIEKSVDMVSVPQALPSLSRGRVPQPDGIVQPATGQQSPIGTPRHPKHQGAMAAQQPGWRQAVHPPDRHQHIRASTGELRAIRTPGDLVERDRVALQNVDTLPTLHFPHP